MTRLGHTREEHDLSLGIVVKAPEGIVLAAESRLTLEGTNVQTGDKIRVSFDNATKLLSFYDKDKATLRPVGAVTYGQAAIGQRTASSYIPEFESRIESAPLSVEDFAGKLSEFYLEQWRAVMPAEYAGPNMTFVVGGYDEGKPYGRVFQVDIPGAPTPAEKSAGDGTFGITWGGQGDVMERLIRGYSPQLPEAMAKQLKLTQAQRKEAQSVFDQFGMPLPLQAMPLQDCVDLAVFFIRTTIAAQSLTVGIRGVGGPIDVATVTRAAGLEFIRRKVVRVTD